ncbi:hypothetical protein MHY87_18405 [Microvirga sp. ACRRW]|nr:hypothetical protein [Microvirga sp. ACRRW]
MIGGAGADKLFGDDGNDTLWGGDGDDTLDGGEGKNMAVFSGVRANYAFSHTSGDDNTQYTVRHNGAGGLDTLKKIRLVKFLGANATDDADDETYALYNSAAPDTVKLSLSSSWSSIGGVRENTATDTSVGSLSASDADGDALTFTLQDNPFFKLDEDGKTIRVKNKDALNFEAFGNGITASYTLKVTVSDGFKNLANGGMTGTATRDVVIKIINEYENGGVVRYGTSAGEQVIGEYGNDRAYGRGGNDQVFGRKGNDKLYGDDGNDFVIGGDGASGAGLIGTGNDTLYGGNGNDSLYGGDGNDLLYGNNGKDVLYGGKGKDTFFFDSRISSANVDHIADFKPADDTIKLARKYFSKISKGTLKAGAFKVGDNSGFKLDADDRILYHKAQGALFYDPDGSGGARAVQFATIAKNLALTHKDFIIF